MALTTEGFRLHGDPVNQRLQQRAMNWCMRFLTIWPSVPDFVVFRGEPGSGKGHLTWALAKQLVEDGHGTARNVKLNDLVRALRECWGDRGGSYDKVLKLYRDSDLLIIDEVSRHAFYGQNIHQHRYDVIDHRIEWSRPTILTTNEEPAGLREILRPALYNRLEGEGGFVEFGSASWRSRQATEEAA